MDVNATTTRIIEGDPHGTPDEIEALKNVTITARKREHQ